jgi:tetratricopeptide (TPR) repeat protein
MLKFYHSFLNCFFKNAFLDRFEYRLAADVLDPALRHFQDMLEIAKFVEDSHLEAQALTSLGDGYYIAHNRKRSVTHIQKAMMLDPSLIQSALPLRTLALSAAYERNINLFRSTEEHMRQAIDSGNVSSPHDILTLYEGSGRARFLLELPDAEQCFSEAQNLLHMYNEEGHFMPLRVVQIMRSWLQYYTNIDNPNLDHATELIQHGVRMANYHGFNRHLKQIVSAAAQLNLEHIAQEAKTKKQYFGLVL